MPNSVPSPLISVIVPVYNVARFLPRCLDSLLEQNIENIEILCINDGSTDSSKRILEEYARRFPNKIFHFEKINGGLSDARNFGIERARGKYLSFVDSDDFVSKNMLATLSHLALKHEAEIVICNLQKVDENEKPGQVLVQLPNFPEFFWLKDRLDAFSDMSYFACNKLFKKSLFSDLEFTKGIHFEDIDLVPRLVLRSKKIAQTQEILYFYRERSDSISRTHNDKGLDILAACEKVASTYEKSEFRENQKALKDFLILEGVYTFLAYFAFVKENNTRKKMNIELRNFREKFNLNILSILFYNRFNKNYFLKLRLTKKIYYLLYFSGLWEFIFIFRKKI